MPKSCTWTNETAPCLSMVLTDVLKGLVLLFFFQSMQFEIFGSKFSSVAAELEFVLNQNSGFLVCCRHMTPIHTHGFRHTCTHTHSHTAFHSAAHTNRSLTCQPASLPLTSPGMKSTWLLMSELTCRRSDPPPLLLSRRHLEHTEQICRTSRRSTQTYGP